MDCTRRRRNRHIFLSGSTYGPYSRARLRLQYQIGTLHRPLRLNLPSNTRTSRLNSQPNYSSLQAEIARRRQERILSHGSGLPSPQPRQQYRELFVPASRVPSGDWESYHVNCRLVYIPSPIPHIALCLYRNETSSKVVLRPYSTHSRA